MMKLRYLILIFLSVFSISLFGQAIPKFDKVIHNFGNIREDEGPVRHSFKFVNRGPKSLKIDTVEADCGCTDIQWSEQNIEKDSMGIVSVLFNPEGKAGNFQKEIRVKFEGLSNDTRLRVIGNVIPGISDPKAYYKKKIGATRFRSNYFNMGKIKSDTSAVKIFDVYNDSDTTINFLEQIGHAGHLEISIEPMQLKAGETGEIKVEYDAEKLAKLGYQNDMITIATDERNRNAMKYINISANVEYAFPEMTEEEKKNAAKIKFDKKEHDFGQIIEGVIIETEFSFTNTGKMPLKIVQTSASCGCTAGVADKEIYEPGESGKINVSFNSKNRMGRQNKFVTIYTNSPLTPRLELNIRGEVVKNVPEGE